MALIPKAISRRPFKTSSSQTILAWFYLACETWEGHSMTSRGSKSLLPHSKHKAPKNGSRCFQTEKLFVRFFEHLLNLLNFFPGKSFSLWPQRWGNNIPLKAVFTTPCHLTPLQLFWTISFCLDFFNKLIQTTSKLIGSPLAGVNMLKYLFLRKKAEVHILRLHYNRWVRFL